MRALLTILFLLFALPAWADVIIFCPKCKMEMFHFLDSIGGIEENSEQFESLIFERCPYDGAPLNGYLYWAWERGQKEPEMRYPAYSFLTKDKEGSLVWKPYELNLN